MPVQENALHAHLESGSTTVCRAWRLTRGDGQVFGFTDHDADLFFDGTSFRADTGLSAAALDQTTGLAVDNTEALGALCAASLREEEIMQGRFDGAEVVGWLVNWADTEAREIQFRGHLGQVRRVDGAFRAELQGLTAGLNRPDGRVFQKPCSAVLGDGACRVDLGQPGYSVDLSVETAPDAQRFLWSDLPGFDVGWFTRGRLEVLEGPAQGVVGMIKEDRKTAKGRWITLWEPLAVPAAVGAQVRLVAGCDKRMKTCRLKFENLLNFRGFPDLPGEDWLLAVPKAAGRNSGGSLR